MKKDESTWWVCYWLFFIALAIVFNTIVGHTHAAEILKNWENIQHPPGIVRVNFYKGPCSDAQAVLIEEAIDYALHSAKTPENGFNYLGRTIFPGYHLSFDSIFTVDCTDTMDIPGRYGESYPVDSCLTNVLGPICANGDTRFLVDGGIHINVTTPDTRIKGIVLHELGHALHLLDHSPVSGSVMFDAGFNTEFSAQYLETWQPDDWCGIRSQRNVGEQEVVVDDRQWAHIPKAWSVDYQGYYSTVVVPMLAFLGSFTKVEEWEACE